MMDFSEGEVLLFDKPLYWTSFDLVRKVKNMIYQATGIKKLKVGHAGTLDPLADGLMIVCTGRATKTIDRLQELSKEYDATFCLGKTTPSFDLETEVDKEYSTAHISKELIQKEAESFLGARMQEPPLFSAKNIQGKRAYEYARKGVDKKLEPKPVVFYEIDILEYVPPQVRCRILCSKGTYIRAFARDLGSQLNSGAYLSRLRRTGIGKYELREAMSLEKFQEKLDYLKQNNNSSV